MTTTFTKEEMIQARQLRSLSQKELLKRLEEHEKLGVLVRNELDAVLLSYERYEALISRLNKLENALEDIQLVNTYGYRVKTPATEWVEQSEGMSTLELYRQRRKK